MGILFWADATSHVPESVQPLMSAIMGKLWIAVVIVVAAQILRWWLKSAKAKGKRGEQIVAGRLRDALPANYKMLNDVYLLLPDGSTTQIDHIVVSEFGVFVVETKNYSGWIFGDAEDATWTQTVYGKKSTFQNPIRQNYRHLCALAETLSLPKECFRSVVAFTGECEFKTQMPAGVVYSRKAAEYIRSFTVPLIDAGQVDEILSSIKAGQARVTDEQKGAHVANLKLRHAAVLSSTTPPRCPRCGGEMVLRTRKSDGNPFYGCKAFPQCRGIAPVQSS